MPSQTAPTGRWRQRPSPGVDGGAEYRVTRTRVAPFGLTDKRREGGVGVDRHWLTAPADGAVSAREAQETFPHTRADDCEGSDAGTSRTLRPVTIVVFPDGSRVRASSISDRRADDPERTYGLYLDTRWKPTWPSDVIAWPDFGLPDNREVAARQITDAFLRARTGLVEVGCLGGRGRTGTVLACMAILAGVPSADAVAWVRTAYRPEAVETAEQEAWVQWFARWVHDTGMS
jgi:hypothetical protein